MIYLTGFHAIEEAIKAAEAASAGGQQAGGQSPGPMFMAKPGPRARELAALALAHKIRVDRVGTHELDRIAPGHRGIALAADGRLSRLGPETDLDAFIAGLGDKKDALALILDEITDPHNYGAILRSCDQFGAGLVISRNRRTAKHAEVIAQTSSGASSWVPAAEEANLPRAVEKLKSAGFWIYGADAEGEAVYTRDLRGRAALVLGGEGSGISRLLKEACDGLVGIPTAGRLDSLNVSVAAGILLYEAARQRRKA
ncbi:MAG: 23S rRNA (guanosine(2251)-2'-O)-methyltransferase RlmB [Treponema sp.]|jgi:23S rRNA (guanosine2251-2'-O)-methyltransferase|nr:23S rRNA (guanosine(2251)-2'-O)-methyltransferase RlmB [Treponema sp.]